MNSTPETASPAPHLPVRALMILVAGLLAAWLAAGSLGWLAPPLQKSFTWLAMAVILGAAVAGRRLARGAGLLLGGAAALAVLMTAPALPVVNILAVAILLAAVARARPGSMARVAAPAAVAATALALFRFACHGSAAIWVFSNAVGRGEGMWAGWLTGRPLLIGASFGGLDFLLLMAALTTVWLRETPRPRLARAAWAVLFIAAAQTAYLVVVAYSSDLVALLPPQRIVHFTNQDLTRLGTWTWGDAIRRLLPWNAPLIAAVLQSAVAVAMFRLAPGLPRPDDSQRGAEPAPVVKAKHRNRGRQPATDLPHRAALAATIRRGCMAACLLIAAAAAFTFSAVPGDLTGRRIVAYDHGAIDWSCNYAGAAPPGRLLSFGLLPALVESLGGQFVRSRDLSDADLRGADVLIVLPPRSSEVESAAAPIPDDVPKRVAQFVSQGGRLVVAGEPETRVGVAENILNVFLAPTKMSFRDDTANSVTERWEDNLESAPHAATAGSRPGRGPFSLDRAASLRVSWPAGPLLAGRWAWDEVGADPDRPKPLAYTPGNHLGDLVLAAQENVGRGTVVALDAAGCLSNDAIPFSYTFTGPLLSALAANHPTPLAWWRQLAGLAAAGTAIVLLFRQLEPMALAVAAIALALAVPACGWLGDATAYILPSGDKTAARPIIYIDGTHLGAMGKDPWGENGVGRLTRILAYNRYLPLVAPDLSPDRLSRAAMLISIAPGRSFSGGEITAVKKFVDEGGLFLSMAGSPEAGPSRALLQEFQLSVDPSPLPPGDPRRETAPFGAFYYPNEEDATVKIDAGWPVSGALGGELWPANDPAHGPVLAGNPSGKGQAFLIGDATFALNKNFELRSPNVAFWTSSLRNWLNHSADKPPADEPGEAGLIDVPKSPAGKGAGS